jgi:hypothetical protein
MRPFHALGFRPVSVLLLERNGYALDESSRTANVEPQRFPGAWRLTAYCLLTDLTLTAIELLPDHHASFPRYGSLRFVDRARHRLFQ